MDRNQIIGIVVISAMLLGYMAFMSGDDEKAPATATTTTQVDSLAATPDSLGADSTALAVVDTLVSDSLRDVQLQAKYGAFAAAAQGTEETIVLENEDIILTLSTKGGSVRSVVLKGYNDHLDQPFAMVTDSSTDFKWLLPTPQGNRDLSELYFQANGKSAKITGKDSAQVVFTMNLGGKSHIQQVYKLKGKGFEVDYRLRGQGLEGFISLDKPLELSWTDRLPRAEPNLEDSRNKASINVYTPDEDFDALGDGPSESDDLFEEPVQWLSMKQRFFSAAILSDGTPFDKGAKLVTTPTPDTSIVKVLNAKLTIPTSVLAGDGNAFRFYFGPNDFDICKTVAPGFHKNVYLGWSLFAFFNRYLVIPVFNVLETFVGSYGLIIFLLVLIIKTLLFPIAFRSYKSMAKMKVLKPQIEELRERLKDDKMKFQQEQMKLYRMVGVNPVSGCIPMLLQMPILLALFNFFPNAIELRGESFLWAPDLSTFDAPITWSQEIWGLSYIFGNHISLFTLLMTVSTIAYTYFNNQANSAQMQGPMKYIGYIMPVIFLFVLNSFPSGLTFYYFTSNLFTIGQQLVAQQLIDKEKIQLKMDENRKNFEAGKPAGKGVGSKFQQRLDAAMKAQQERDAQKKGGKR